MSKIGVTIDGQNFEVEINLLPNRELEFTAVVNGEVVTVAVPTLEAPDQIEWVLVDNRPYEVVIDTDLRWIKAYDGMHHLEVRDLEAPISRPLTGDSRIKAPIPGLVTRVMVGKGDAVEAGQSLLVLEAMKMENEIMAPRAGVISALNVHSGQSVTLGEVLVEIA